MEVARLQQPAFSSIANNWSNDSIRTFGFSFLTNCKVNFDPHHLRRGFRLGFHNRTIPLLDTLLGTDGTCITSNTAIPGLLMWDAVLAGFQKWFLTKGDVSFNLNLSALYFHSFTANLLCCCNWYVSWGLNNDHKQTGERSRHNSNTNTHRPVNEWMGKKQKKALDKLKISCRRVISDILLNHYTLFQLAIDRAGLQTHACLGKSDDHLQAIFSLLYRAGIQRNRVSVNYQGPVVRKPTIICSGHPLKLNLSSFSGHRANFWNKNGQ